MPLAAHGVSHRGRRKSNEDAMVLDPDRGLFVVADGMGGHNAGEVASALAVKTLHEFISDAGETNEATLAEAMCLANDQVLNAAAGNSTYEGMGTTVVAACVNDSSIIFGNVGDSRIYLMRGGSLQQLTNDDSWVSKVLPADAIGSEEASRHPMRHVLTKVIGLREDMEPTVGSSPFATGDTTAPLQRWPARGRERRGDRGPASAIRGSGGDCERARRARAELRQHGQHHRRRRAHGLNE